MTRWNVARRLASMVCLAAFGTALSPAPVLAFKPKTHLYLALRAIERLAACKIEIQNVLYDMDPDICEAIQTYKSDYLGGVIGPDAFPDLLFGQGFIHPDTRCVYEAQNDGDCADGASTTWSSQWTKKLWEAAHDRTRPRVARMHALAFVVGFLTHSAGDMWAHTFVNRYAGGSWPELSDIGHLDIALRHVVVEGVIAEHTADIKDAVTAAGGLTAPTDFIYDVLIDDDWSRAHSSGSLIGMVYKLRDELISKRGDAPSAGDYTAAVAGLPPAITSIVRYHYLNCWIGEIDQGLQAWPNVSLQVADAMFVREQTGLVWDPLLKNYKDDHLRWMLGGLSAPDQLLLRCSGMPSAVQTVVSALLNPAQFIADAVGSLTFVNPLRPVFDQFKDYMFKAITGLDYSDFMNRMNSPSNFLQPPLFPSATVTRSSLLSLMNLDANGLFNNNTFSPSANTILLGKLALMSPEGLDAMLAQYNVGPLYGTAAYTSPDMKPNVMLGFMRSFDGNHQWRDNAPPLPITEPERRFGDGMLLYKDCLARRNFFKRVFRDWSYQSTETVYYDESEEDCLRLSNLPPVSMTVDAIGQGVYSLGNGSFWAPGCGSVALRIRLTNHQTFSPDFALLVTDDMEASSVVMRVTGLSVPTKLRLCTTATAVTDRLFHRVLAGQLPAIPTTGPNSSGHTKEFLVVLPCLGGVTKQYRVYLLEHLWKADLPLLINNPIIKPNDAEYLTVSITPVDIALVIDVPDKPILCVTPPTDVCAVGPTWSVAQNASWKHDSIGVCESCGSQSCDADGDNRANDADNCSVTANTDQRDSDGDRIGNECDPLSIAPLLDDWIQGRLPDERFIQAMSRYPYLFDFPTVPDGPRPLPSWSTQFPITSAAFRRYTAEYAARRVPESRYMATLKALVRGATYKAEGVRVTAAEVRVSPRSQTVKIVVDAKAGGRVRLDVPRFVLDGPTGSNSDATFSLRATGARPGRLVETFNGDTRSFDVRIRPGTTQLLLERR